MESGCLVWVFTVILKSHQIVVFAVVKVHFWFDVGDGEEGYDLVVQEYQDQDGDLSQLSQH